MNQQGADKGTQYRSVIYYHDNNQKTVATSVINAMVSYFDKPIVTEISMLDIFYEADKEHQNYYNNNSNQGYCNFVIAPKLAKLRKIHSNKLK